MSTNFKRFLATLLSLICCITTGTHIVTAKHSVVNTTTKTAKSASMISGLFNLIKNANKDKFCETAANENTIKVFFHKEAAIKEVSLEEYIKGVLYGEMPSSYSLEALKAQAVAARTYTVYRIRNGSTHRNGADICTDYTHCQAWTADSAETPYPEAIERAVEETKNTICTYNGECINAMYFSNSGGATEAIENVWGGREIPYLKSVASPGESVFYDFCQVKTYSYDEFAAAVDSYFDNDADIDVEVGIKNIQNIKRSPAGRIISAEIGGITSTGLQIRAMFSLRSSNVYFSQDGSTISIVALGYGHGVGMSQCGAQAMAENGADWVEILKHYYTGIDISLLC